MCHAAERACALEVVEPPFAFGSVDQRALMRAVDACCSLFEHAAHVVWTVDVFRASYGLPSRAYAPFGYAEIEISVLDEKFCTLGGGTVVHLASVVKKGLAVGAHAVYDYRASAQLTAAEPCVAFIVPDRARVFPAAYFLHLVQRFPRTGGVGGRGHEQTVVWRAEIEIEAAVVVAQRRCP